MTPSMSAALLREFGQPLVLEALPVPQPGAGEVLVKTRACGIDGTDLKLLNGFGYTPNLPFVMGHEIAGSIAALGEGVEGFTVGDRVIVYNFVTCGRCLYCLTYREQLCVAMGGVIGVLGVHGGYAEYVKVPARQLVRLPDQVDWADGAICCDAGLTAFHALERSGALPGETLLIIGVGGVGSFLTQLAAMAGLRVITVDRGPDRLTWAHENGASAYLSVDQVPDIPAAVRDLTDGLGADRVIDVVGLESTMVAGLNALRKGGRMVIVGYTPENCPVPGKQLAQNELELVGTRAGRRRDLQRCVDLVAQGKIQSIVRYRYPLSNANQALDHLRSGGATGRIVLTYD